MVAAACVLLPYILRRRSSHVILMRVQVSLGSAKSSVVLARWNCLLMAIACVLPVSESGSKPPEAQRCVACFPCAERHECLRRALSLDGWRHVTFIDDGLMALTSLRGVASLNLQVNAAPLSSLFALLHCCTGHGHAPG